MEMALLAWLGKGPPFSLVKLGMNRVPRKGDRLMREEREEDISLEGLTDEQVERRVAAGLTNRCTNDNSKTTKQIIREHACTLFNAINLVLALVVILTGEWYNLSFMCIVIANLVIGVTQELRARKMVERLSILTSGRIRAIRSGQVVEVSDDDIVVDDVIILRHGDQVPADVVVLKGAPLLDESLLTGESEPIPKGPGDVLFSGSNVIAGDVTCRVVRVGDASYASQLGAQARYLKPVNSEIRSSLSMIVELAVIPMIPLGIGLFLRTCFVDQTTLSEAALSTVAAVLGMVPQGLMLLTSSVLAIATVRLAHKNVLIQQVYCVETLARVDTLCLDKTGTITSGQMEVTQARPVGETSVAELERAFCSVAHGNASDANETASALLGYASERGINPEDVERVIPFSSARKYSGCVCKDGHAYVMGAAQFVIAEQMGELRSELDSFGELERVLVVCEVDGFTPEDAIEGDVRLMGFVALRDEVRPTAAQTMAYFADQGVDLKVISGDDPRTVSGIARSVGIKGADAYVDASTLKTDEDLAAAVKNTCVFGRVTPEQKRSLVRALQADGHTVAMTGDGVNDVLALKEADCSVSMSSGSSAARSVSEVVLVDNDFSHMPEVVAEGRRSINNLERSASLFIVKTLFSAALTFLCIFFPPYPFLPVQMSLFSGAAIGWPSFVLSLEPNKDRISGKFLVNVLRKSLPAAVAIVITLLAVQFLGDNVGMDYAQRSTCALILSSIIGVELLVTISKPLTPLRKALIASVVTMLFGGMLLFPKFLALEPLTVSMTLFLIVFALCGTVIFHNQYEWLNAPEPGENDPTEQLTRLVNWLEERYNKRHESEWQPLDEED